MKCVFAQAPQRECHWLRGQGRLDQASAGSRGLGGKEAPAAAAEDAVGNGEREAAGTAG